MGLHNFKLNANTQSTALLIMFWHFLLWPAFKVHRLYFVAIPVFSYCFHDIFNGHALVQTIWGISMLEFSASTIIDFVCLDRDDIAEGSSDLPCIWDRGMLVSYLTCVCETLEKMCIMMVLCNSDLIMALGNMAWCHSRDVDWL